MVARTPPAGYSGTPLSQKLGIRQGHRVALVGAPPAFAGLLAPLPDDVQVQTRLGDKAPLDVVVAFFTRRADLERRLPGLRARLAEAGGLWIAWPKRASGVTTDMTEDAVRKVALPTGLVDNKVCAIDEVWSGLRLVLRKSLRGRWRA